MCLPHGVSAPWCVQVIEDSVAVVAAVRKERAVPRSAPNIVIGGSYGESRPAPTWVSPFIHAPYAQQLPADAPCHPASGERSRCLPWCSPSADVTLSKYAPPGNRSGRWGSQEIPPLVQESCPDQCCLCVDTDCCIQARSQVCVVCVAGGMLAAYHRLKRPDFFAAAVASSAPMQYISE